LILSRCWAWRYVARVDQLAERVARVAAEHRFSGVVRVDRSGQPVLAEAFGFAERAYSVPNTIDTRFGIASACKGLTALTVVSLIQEGHLDLATTARSVLGPDLPEIDDRVTVEHLLAHRSGIGDYFDEDGGLEATDYVLRVPVHELATTEGYLRALEGRPQKFSPGGGFSYCNSGYVVLALIAERVGGLALPDLVAERVCAPAGMRFTAFLRSDELPADVARGYLGPEGLRTNVLHLPVRGGGDGGVYSTVGDIHAMWQAVFEGRVVPMHWVDEMVRPRSDVPEESRRYGLGFWLHEARDDVILEGYDAGVSFRSVHSPSAAITWTVVSNDTDGAWPVTEHLRQTVHA
jgi:CubicO group peptidase (beta-lactamase class C family)